MQVEHKLQLEYEKKFYLLAQKLDKIVLKSSKDSFIINNQSLHLTRNHPEYLDFWKPVIYSEKITRSMLLKILLSLLYSIFVALIILIRELLAKNTLASIRYRLNSNLEFVIISHFLGGDNLSDDLYYGELFCELGKRDIKFLKLTIPHASEKNKSKVSELSNSITLDSSLPKTFIIKYIFMNLIALLKILYFGFKANFNFYEILVIVLGQVNNFNNVKFAYNVERAIIDCKPNKLIMTFEGNALERSIFYACHKNGVESIGFQHAPIIPSQYSIFRRLEPQLEPDIILTSGEYTKKIFIDRLGASARCKVLGSSKNVHTKIDLKEIVSRKILKILLVPDGNANSILKFLELGLFLGKRLPTYEICIRAHPLFISFLKNEMVQNHSESLLKYSNSLLDLELTNSKWVIYENSSVAIQAGFYGCNLVYYANPLANIDPLFDLFENKFIVNSQEEIYAIVKNNSDFNILRVEKVSRFSANYFSQLDVSVLL
jgi:hypothetical protein